MSRGSCFIMVRGILSCGAEFWFWRVLIWYVVWVVKGNYVSWSNDSPNTKIEDWNFAELKVCPFFNYFPEFLLNILFFAWEAAWIFHPPLCKPRRRRRECCYILDAVCWLLHDVHMEQAVG